MDNLSATKKKEFDDTTHGFVFGITDDTFVFSITDIPSECIHGAILPRKQSSSFADPNCNQ